MKRTTSIVDREGYFKEFKYTTEVVKPYLIGYLKRIKKSNQGLYDSIMYFSSARVDKMTLLQKPFITRLVYQACGGDNWEKYAPIFALTELLNISSYQANLSLDGKKEITSKQQRGNQFISAMITRELIDMELHCLDGLVNSSTQQKLSSCFSTSNMAIYEGQYLDSFFLKIDTYDFTSFDKYVEDYVLRCTNLSGVFTQQSALIGAILADASESYLVAVQRFGLKFGTALHMLNDLSDIIPQSLVNDTTLKKAQDQFSDLRNGKLTAPIAYSLFCKRMTRDRNILMGVGTSNLSLQKQKAICEMLTDNGSIQFARSLISKLRKEAKYELHLLDKSKYRDFLSILCSQLKSNKYYYSLRRFNGPERLR